MHHFTTLLTTLLCALAFFFGSTATADAQGTDAGLVSFTASKVIMEDDPNAGTYCFTFYSPDGMWKAQLYYHSADGMCGTFTSSTADGSTDAFDLKGDGRYYNYVRNPQNDMVFYTFSDITLTVADEVTTYRVAADCKASNGVRYVMEGSVDALIPTSTVESDLGYAYIVENPFYETFTFTAENDDYRLAYGIASKQFAGTFYRADILMPELTDKHTGESIKVASATATHTAEGDTKHLAIDIVSEDHVLYRFTMYNAPLDIDVTEEISVNLGLGCALQDLRDVYGCYQIGGQNSAFGVAIAFKPEALESGRKEWTMDDIFMPYTALLRFNDSSEDLEQATRETIIDIHAVGNAEPHLFTVMADIMCMSGRLYHVAMGVADDEYMPEADEKVDINFGKVAVVDYSKGLGNISIGAVQQGKYQLRFTVRAAKLEGEFSTADVVSEYTDIMVVKENTYSFHDAQVFKAQAVKAADGNTYIDVNLLATDGVLYHCQMYIEDLKCMGEDQQVDVSFDSDALMLAVQEGADGDYAEYTLQYQLLPANYNPMLPISTGEVYSFYFAHRGATIAGDYSYSDGTLDTGENFLFYQRGTEIRVAPVAGTLSLKAADKVVIDFDGTSFTTNLYSAEFHVLGQNGVVYNGEGDNYLVVIDEEGNLTNITEGIIDSVYSALAERGYTVRKTLQNGRMLLTTPSAAYSANGARIKR